MIIEHFMILRLCDQMRIRQISVHAIVDVDVWFIDTDIPQLYGYLRVIR